MRFFEDMAGAMAGLSNRLSNFGGANDNPALLARPLLNPLQSDLNEYAKANNGKVIYSEFAKFAMEEKGRTSSEVADMRNMNVGFIEFDEVGLDMVGGTVYKGGMQAQTVRYDPYSTYEHMDTHGGARPTTFQNVEFVGYDDKTRSEPPALEGVTIGNAEIIGNSVHLSFEKASISHLDGAGTHLSTLKSEGSNIAADFTNARGLGLDIKDGQFHGALDGTSVAPDARISDAVFVGSMRDAAGVVSFAGSTIHATAAGDRSVFAGTDISSFDFSDTKIAGDANQVFAGAIYKGQELQPNSPDLMALSAKMGPPEKARTSVAAQEALLRGDLAASAANMVADFGRAGAKTDAPVLAGADDMEAALAKAYSVAKALQGQYGGDGVVAESHVTQQHTVDHSAEYSRSATV